MAVKLRSENCVKVSEREFEAGRGRSGNLLEGSNSEHVSFESAVLNSAAQGRVRILADAVNDKRQGGETHFHTPGAFSGGCWE